MAGQSVIRGNTTFKGNVTLSSGKDLSIGDDLSITDDLSVGGDAAVTGNATIGGTLAVTGAVSLTATLTKANVRPNVSRMVLVLPIGGGGTLADSTTYRGFIVPGRAGTVTKISLIAGTPTVGGTNTFKVLKGSSSGNSMLAAATYDPTGLTANQASSLSLTATSADLQIAASGANSGIYVEYACGTQTTDAINVAVAVEFEADDY